jgi:hypothetical protein
VPYWTSQFRAIYLQLAVSHEDNRRRALVSLAPQESIVAQAAPDFSKSLQANVAQLLSGPDRRPLICLLAFGIIWAIELFWVQHTTLVTLHSGGPRFDLWAPKIRLILDVFFVASMCMLLRPPYLMVVAIASFALNALLVMYQNRFQQPLSSLTVLTTYQEGIQLAGFAWAWFPKVWASALATTLVVKLVLLWNSRNFSFLPKTRWMGTALFVFLYAGLFCITVWLDPLNAILTKRGVGRLGMIRGYTGPWLAELYYLTDPVLLKNAISRAQTRSDVLTPIETPIPIHEKLVILQVESLDYNILDYRFNGREVTPFLNRLKQQSLFYRARCYHMLGSADADFTMLVGGPPAMNVLNYNLNLFPYDSALPYFLDRRGFGTSSFHGNNGAFYNRKNAFGKMGFEQMYFREEMEGLGTFKIDGLGLRDRDVFTFSSLKLRTARKPTCHFIITLTSHTPYTFLAADENLFISNPTNGVERYFNHIHYVDDCLRDYITSLGKGVTVVIYADHPTEEGHGNFKPSRVGAEEFVPVFIYDTDRDLSKLQKTRDSDLALGGTLRMIDISAYLRNQLQANFKPARRDPSIPTVDSNSRPAAPVGSP